VSKAAGRAGRLAAARQLAGVPNAFLSGDVEGLVVKDSHFESASGDYMPIKTE
jgi:hypothetical protein